MGDFFAGIFNNTKAGVSSVGDFFDDMFDQMTPSPSQKMKRYEKTGELPWQQEEESLFSRVAKAGVSGYRDTSDKTVEVSKDLMYSNVDYGSADTYKQNASSSEFKYSEDFEAFEKQWLARMYGFLNKAEESEGL